MRPGEIGGLQKLLAEGMAWKNRSTSDIAV